MNGSEEVALSPREFDIVAHFFRNAEKVVSREAILEALGKDAELYDRTIDSNVSHVRARLRAAGIKSVQITSVYGVGYRLEKK